MTGRNTKRMRQKGQQAVVIVVLLLLLLLLVWMEFGCVCVCQGNGLAKWLIHLLWQMDVGVPARNFLCFSFVK